MADFRAATPSAAAEIITEGAFASRQFLAEAADRITRLVRRRVEQDKDELQAFHQRLARVHPRRILEQRLQYLDDAQISMNRCLKHGYRHYRTAWENLRQRLQRLRPSQILALHRQAVTDLNRILRDQIKSRLQNPQNALRTLDGATAVALSRERSGSRLLDHDR